MTIPHRLLTTGIVNSKVFSSNYGQEKYSLTDFKWEPDKELVSEKV